VTDLAPTRDAYGYSRGRVRHGLKWVAISLAVAQAVRFLTTAVLTRFIIPDLLGLVTVANGVIGILAALREIGLAQAYVQRRDADEEEARLAADSTFVLTLATNLVLMVAAYLSVPWIVGFFGDAGTSTALAAVLRVLFLTFVVDAFLATPSFVLQKRLEFGKLSVAEIAGGLTNAAIALSLALSGFGVWSLVWGQLGSRVVQTVVAMRLSGWVPRLRFSRAIARQLFDYGKYLWGFSALSAVGGVFDRLVVGKESGMGKAGEYGLALQLCTLPAVLIASLVNRISFPALSRIQADRPALRRAFLKALSHVAILSLPVALGMLAVARPLVLTACARSFSGMVPIVEVLALYGLTLSLSSIVGPVLKAIGKPQALLYTSLVHHALLFPLLVVVGPQGPVHVAWAILVPLFVSSCIAFFLAVANLDLRKGDVSGVLLRPALCAVTMLVAVRGLLALLDPRVGELVQLVCAVLAGALVYAGSSLILNRKESLEFLQTVREVVAAEQGERSGEG